MSDQLFAALIAIQGIAVVLGIFAVTLAVSGVRRQGKSPPVSEKTDAPQPPKK